MNLTLLKRFETVEEAQLIAGLLQGSGIHCVVQNDGIPGFTGLLQGSEVYVDEKDLERAKGLL